jgi:ParB/RepB/Spo0J family partition protein
MTTTATAERALNILDPDRVYQVEGHNPRGEIDTSGEPFRELVESVKAQGILTPILVGPPDDDGYPVIAGHRRHLAALEAGVKLPAMVADLNGDGGAFAAAVAENLIRQDLTPAQEARALRHFREDLGMTQADAAKAMSKSERWARERQRILNLPESVQQAIDAGEIPTEATNLLERVAKASPELLEAIAEAAVKAHRGDELLDPAEMVSRLDAKAGDHGLQPTRTQYGTARARLKDLAVDEEAAKRIQEAAAEMPKHQHLGPPAIEWTPADEEKAKKAGAFLSIAYEKWGQKATAGYITDPAVTAQLAEAKLPEIQAEREDYAKRFDRVTSDSGSTEDKAKEKAKAELLQRLEQMGNPRAEVGVVKAICALAIGPDPEEIQITGLGALGVERYQQDGEGNVLEELEQAKTAGEAIRVTLQHLVAAGYRDQAGTSHGRGSSYVYGIAAAPDAEHLVDEAVDELELLPKRQQREVERRRKARAKAIAAAEERRAKQAAAAEETADQASDEETAG